MKEIAKRRRAEKNVKGRKKRKGGGVIRDGSVKEDISKNVSGGSKGEKRV